MLQLKHIHKHYGEKTVADDINLEVGDGELLAILGRSGCGKSTLLKIIAGLVQADSGEVWINGADHTQRPPEQRGISLVFQDYALLPHLNTLQNVAFGLKMQGIGRKESYPKAMEMLAEVGLGNEAQRRVESLSGGEQQRVALARALVTDPQLMLLDESFSSLDTGLRHHLRQFTADHIRRRNIPAVMVTHDPEEAFTLADHIALMDDGKILQTATPDALINRPVNARAARLIGAYNVNDTHYIPQQALHFNQAGGTICTVTQFSRLPDHNLLGMQHPQYGEILLLPDPAQTEGLDLQTGSRWPLRIDEDKIVWFGR